MISPKPRRVSVEEARAGAPAGILVLDRRPTPPLPQLRAYVWSRERTDHSSVPGGPKRPAPWALMVGPKGSMPREGWVLAV
jgi:hypothetical protein